MNKHTGPIGDVYVEISNSITGGPAPTKRPYVFLTIDGPPNVYYCRVYTDMPLLKQAQAVKEWMDSNGISNRKRCFNSLRISPLYDRLAPYLIKEAEEIGYDLGLSDDVRNIINTTLNTNHRM